MENLKQKAYNIIKDKILRCEYAPNFYLSEKIIIDSLGMSRTPVRDALGRLEQEGLVKIQPKKGIWVAGLTFQDVNHLFEFRKLVEIYAMRSHAHKIEKDTLQCICDEVENNSFENAEQEYALDDEFHELLINNTGNNYAIQAYASMKNQIHRLRILTGRYGGRNNHIDLFRREHAAILRAMLEEDYKKATEALEIHLTNSYSSSLSVLLEGCSEDILSFTNDGDKAVR